MYVVDNLLKNTDYDVVVFLDSDAWIQNGFWLNDIINNLMRDEEKQGCFSRDPYVKKNTFINSGSFIIKNNDFTKQMYKNIITNFENDLKHNEGNTAEVRRKNNGWCDQYYISKYIFENKEQFVIFVPDILNTPIGKVLRHNWLKNQKMYDDLNNLISIKNEDISANKTFFIETDYYDNEIFPNTIENGYEYYS
jgi:hypothetical protein